LLNYFGKNQRIEFATEVMKFGMDAFQVWYNSSFLSFEASETLSKLIKQWKTKPDLDAEEIKLLVGYD
jgi:hypothetical protein